MDKTTLVTGGTGLVGFNIIRSLLRRKRKVKALVRSLEKGKRILPAEVELAEGDILNMDSLKKAAKGCQVIYHAAGWPEQWLRDPKDFYKVNVEGTQNMIDTAIASGVDTFIYTSTIDVFEGKKGEHFDEQVIARQPRNTHYERSKQLAFEQVIKSQQEGFPAISLHPAAVYGPGIPASPGINDFIVDLSKGKIPLLLPGGMPLVFSEDVGEGHVLAEEKGKLGESYILSDSYYELPAIAEACMRFLRMDKKIPPVMPLSVVKVVSHIGEWISRWSGKPPLIPKGQLEFLQWGAIPDSSRAQRELGWEPLPLEKGLPLTIGFLKKEKMID